ncbi:MAG: DUF4286 family protein [Caulobacterales bacterium]
MAKFIFIALANAAEGRDDEFNAWYNNQHIPDVLRVGPFKTAQRFKVVGEGANKYLTIYEVEAESAAAAQAKLKEAAMAGKMPMTDSADRSSGTNGFFEPITERFVQN